MKRQFVITAEGIKIKVLAKSSHNQYKGLKDMQKVGSYSFIESQTGKNRGSATRYYQKCQEIMLLADTVDEIKLAVGALAWLEENDVAAWQAMVWNTSDIGDPEDFRNSSSEQESQQEQSDEKEDSQSEYENDEEENASQKLDNSQQIEVGTKEIKKQLLTKKKQTKDHNLRKRKTTSNQKTKFQEKSNLIKDNNSDNYTNRLRKRHRP